MCMFIYIYMYIQVLLPVGGNLRAVSEASGRAAQDGGVLHE